MRRRGFQLLLPLALLGCAGVAPRADDAPPHAAASTPEIAPAPVDSLAAAPSAAGPAEAAAYEDGETAADDTHATDELDDGLQLPPDPDAAAQSTRPASPLAGLTDAQISERLAQNPGALGSLSLGSTNAGALLNGVQMPEGDRWELVDAAHAWGTRETVDYLARAIDAVHRRFPGSPKLYIGHISARRGGYLSPHKSHQAGRDVDISYFLDARHRWYGRATAKNLDRDRTWAFVRALIIETDVEMILIDSSVQRLLKDHALKIGEDPAWIDDIFQVGSRCRRPLIRHAKGHATHIHVRFYNPVAQESAVLAYQTLLKAGAVKPPVSYVRHTARKGQTLGSLARKYGTTVEAIQKANGLRSTLIHARHTYNIPRPGKAPAAPKHVSIPPRRLPPTQHASAGQARSTAAGGQEPKL